MPESPRYPIAIVRRLKPPAPARVGGRVVERREDGVRVRDVSGELFVAGPGAALGAWVVAEGTWNGERLEGRCRLLNAPRVPYPRPDGDAAWFADGRLERLRERAAMKQAVRDFFAQRAFLEVETPAMVPSPGLDLHLDAFEVQPGALGDGPRWLITSPEYQMKRVLAGGAARIVQIARCFRDGERGRHHEPEFTMVEWYRAFAGSAEVMRDTEQLVAHVARGTREGSTVIPARGTPVDVAPPWERLTVAEALERYAGKTLAALLPDEERFFRVWIEEVEPQLGRGRPVFVTHWPASMASLARLDPRDPSVADRFEAYVDGLELCNGFGELVDPVEQRDRLERDQRAREEAGKPAYPIDERFLGALEEGLPPCGGNALGFDRLVMLVLGAAHIEDVLALPSRRL
ncbi:MAG TPA: EF-P lysine aminoacylase EpmA [Polyangiaceae bacterium LLY-WYZ-15_(1-7)]|nr:EF-P lysine aminoacylase EpmA [Polyangiaceae bacterium LLY-WYZ-15_(1-7)]HJL06738.1 EF-P lysine aminoacylase EpmA [Polyangiaceae bacterium LLY-WYZ-15_(1-7)]HJL13459.1 EF-P lysine aminoacylase EpmA [Polyangiaceae bacterium LLY-WYZ-15_(1-7)]HJL24912.1 EF-P lysine aminoacylase EpmA [Polyangiaceae bacterium LLY-WYZ-15_(1-7)]HJL29047.1 EF-P lysine aminoacylase EpmA [Polyangiaceae bacterium LLY-WYZ-15_(1-7)]